MKILTIHRLRAQQNVEQLKIQQKRILTLCEPLLDNASACDTCVYGLSSSMPTEMPKEFCGTLYTYKSDNYSLTSYANTIALLLKEQNYDIVLFAAEEGSADIAGLVAAKCGHKFFANVEAIAYNNNRLQIQKPVYNNNLTAEFAIALPAILTCKLPELKENFVHTDSSQIIELDDCKKPGFLLNERIISHGKEQSESAVLIAVGMGVSDKDELVKIRNFAEKNNFNFGVTRPVAMRGWASIDDIVGVSGTIYSPKLTVAIGISGAAAFYVGIEKSEYILSINTNVNASIIKQSDAVLNEDYKSVIDGLFERLTAK